MNNYETTKQRVMAEFKNYDHNKIASRLGLAIREKYLFIELLGSSYRINIQNGLTECISNENEIKEADFNVVMTLFDILCYSTTDVKPTNEYTLLHQLSTVQNACSYAGEGFFKKYEDLFDKDINLFKNGCTRMGGVPFGKGDASYLIPMFRDMKVQLSFWQSDEDFPPKVDIMCDKNILEYMHYETTWYMASHLLQKISSGSE